MCVDHLPSGVYSHERDTGGNHENAMLTLATRRTRRVMPAVLAWLAVLLLAGGHAPAAAAQPAAGAQAAARVEPGLVLEIEVFCSETQLRMSNARLTWRAPAAALGAGVASLSAATQQLEATVFKNGFERGLFVALPIGAAAPERPVAAVVQGTAAQQQQQPPRRAFQIRLIEVTAARTAAAAPDTSEMDAVVENLEPGVNYTWRMAVTAAGGRIASRPVTVRALVCPADLVEPPPPAQPRRQP